MLTGGIQFWAEFSNQLSTDHTTALTLDLALFGHPGNTRLERVPMVLSATRVAVICPAFGLVGLREKKHLPSDFMSLGLSPTREHSVW